MSYAVPQRLMSRCAWIGIGLIAGCGPELPPSEEDGSAMPLQLEARAAEGSDCDVGKLSLVVTNIGSRMVCFSDEEIFSYSFSGSETASGVAGGFGGEGTSDSQAELHCLTPEESLTQRRDLDLLDAEDRQVILSDGARFEVSWKIGLKLDDDTGGMVDPVLLNAEVSIDRDRCPGDGLSPE